MCWTVVLTTLLETAEEDSEATRKREAKAVEKLRDERAESAKSEDGGVLAADRSSSEPTVLDVENAKRKSFKKLLRESSNFLQHVLSDAVTFARDHTPREKNLLDKMLRKTTKSSQLFQPSSSTSMFATSVWPSLKSRGWTAEVMSDGNAVGKTRYSYKGKEVSTYAVWVCRCYSRVNALIVGLFSIIRLIQYWRPRKHCIPNSEMLSRHQFLLRSLTERSQWRPVSVNVPKIWL